MTVSIKANCKKLTPKEINMTKKNKIIMDDHIISMYDLTSFVSISKKLDSKGIFDLINSLHILTIDILQDQKPIIIKNIGDASLIVFSKDNVNKKVALLLKLKIKIEEYLKNKGYQSKVSFSSHFGEITIGEIGNKPYNSIDAFGENINTTFIMNGKPFKSRFTISPQLFRKLDKESRKIFHKYTQPIVYIAD